MIRDFFTTLEQHRNNSPLALTEVIEQLAFNEQGLIPVITQDTESQRILMFAWMNHEALHKTLATRCMTYWSRSRKRLWVKGETSGHRQRLVAISFDCDGDAILCQVTQQGAACHTGRQSCFYLEAELDSDRVWVADN